MKAEIKDVLEIETYGNLKDFRPENPDWFYVGICMSIGVSGEQGIDYFDAAVCSVAYFKQWTGRRKIDHQRGLIVVAQYDYQAVSDCLNHIVMMYDEPDWPALANQLNRHFLWEYDKMQPLT